MSLTRTALLVFFCLVIANLSADAQGKRRALLASIPKHDVMKYLALYELYPETPEGKKALNTAFQLLSGGHSSTVNQLKGDLALSPNSIQAIVGLVNKQDTSSLPKLSNEDLDVIQHLGQRLANRKLKGYHARSQDEVLNLPPDEIDLARGVFLSHISEGEMREEDLLSYEAMLDLMALQISARLTQHPKPEEVVREISHFIFHEMNYRFPPHSQFIKEIDEYSFLPSVLDSRRGVCLGVSILYACVAQRLGLPLELVTPPGHIFVRYRAPDGVINIETTARGIHIDTDEYMGVEAEELPQRNIKEAIGMVHFNHASVYWQNEQFDKAIEAYNRAKIYMGDDPILINLMGYVHLINGDEAEGRACLEKSVGILQEKGVRPDALAEEYLDGKCNADTILACYQHVDEKRDSLYEKKAKLVKCLEDYPTSRGALFSIAGTLMQLNRLSEALGYLERYHELDQGNITIEYFLAGLYAERKDFQNTWDHLIAAETLAEQKGRGIPRPLRQLRRELKAHSPD